MYFDAASNTITLKPTSNWSADSKVEIKMDKPVGVPHRTGDLVSLHYFLLSDQLISKKLTSQVLSLQRKCQQNSLYPILTHITLLS
jgi:hypothetical protein